MHFPKTALQTGRFGRQGGLAGVLVHGERKIAKNFPHVWMILFYHLIEKRGDVLAGRAFEIAEFFKRDRSVRVATNMNGFRRAPAGHRFICGDGQAMRLHRLTQQRTAGKRGQCDHTNNNESEIAFHTSRRSRNCGTRSFGA